MWVLFLGQFVSLVLALGNLSSSMIAHLGRSIPLAENGAFLLQKCDFELRLFLSGFQGLMLLFLKHCLCILFWQLFVVE